jgi:hypothetical protein
MKIVFRFCVAAILCVGAASCTKSSGTSGIVAPPNPSIEPFIYSKINPSIAQPARMQLGTASSILNVGDQVTIFLPYSSWNEEFVSRTITMIDQATNEPIGSYVLTSSEDPSASDLILPEDMLDKQQFFFVTFVIDENYIGKSITLKTTLQGQHASSFDEMPGAFNVLPDK